jgi:branched-chain amino acid transport system substrate-binding protein
LIFNISCQKEREKTMATVKDERLAKKQKGMNVTLAIGTFLLFWMVLLSGGLSSPAVAADKGPIKIGYICPSTGNFAQMGIDMVDGFKMFLEEINYTAGGRKIELIVEDEGDSPAVAVTKARKLVNADKVHIMAGVFLTPSAYAVAPIFEEAKIPFVVTSSGGDDLTQRKRSKNLIRLTYTGCNLGHAAGDYAYHKLGWRKVVTVGFDYAFSHEVVGGFQQVFEDAGGKVIQKIWPPLNAMDFSPYVATLKRDADGLFDAVVGSASVRFLRAVRISGLMNKWKVLAAGSATDEWLLPALGDLGLGVYSSFNWSAVLQTPENIKFVEKARKLMKRETTVGMASNYTGADWIVRAIKAVNGNVEDQEKMMQALRSVEISNSPRGPLKLDSYGHNIQNMYIRRIDKVNNQYQNTILETYPSVSQFWKYDPETYLKSPVYNRDNPPCRYCE